MLVWLDGQTSRKGKPNENFAREVMELFTLGVGNFTEQDVRQLARAFTGWRIEEDHSVLHKDQFDDREKTIFGETDEFDSDSAIDLILQQPAAPRHLATKMLCEFVHPEPTEDQIDHYAKALVDANWQVKPVLRDMVSSRMFFSPWAYRSRIKSPAELVVGSALAIGGKPNIQFLREAMSKMGQNLLYPPNVKGWDGDRAWINSNTILVRLNFCMSIATGRNPGGSDAMARKNDRIYGLKSADEVLDVYGRLLLDGKIAKSAREKLTSYLNIDDKGKEQLWVDSDTLYNKVRDTLHMMMTVPEYQLA
jgi:uncharacterized protein (DUF1800 family)